MSDGDLLNIKRRVGRMNSKYSKEKEIENQLKTNNVVRGVPLGGILAVYRNLRENYEFRMRYDVILIL